MSNSKHFKKILDTFGISESKLVINLLSSTCGYVFYKTKYKEYLENNEFGTEAPHIEENGAIKSLNQLKLFMMDHLIPYATDNKALIITDGCNSCTLTNAIGQMAADIFKLSESDNLPFHLLCIVSEGQIG